MGILEKINAEDQKVAIAVGREIPSIARAVDSIVRSLQNQGRLYYLGAGTSGRLAIIDAAELLPTFGVGTEYVRAIIAGGRKAMFRPVEGIEDLEVEGEKCLQRSGFSKADILIGISASGRTPFVAGALAYSRGLGATTIALTSNPSSRITKIADIAICPRTGPEVITGSTRMKAGTAQKLVLNMISTSVMVKLGKVHGNLMVSLKPVSRKLKERQKRIIMQATGLSHEASERILTEAKRNVKIAIVMGKSKLDYREAEKLLKKSGDSLDRAITTKRKISTDNR
jgi:N-acetylmuramic acid 6-phosphate etherase